MLGLIYLYLFSQTLVAILNLGFNQMHFVQIIILKLFCCVQEIQTL